ncbi:S41 family peptidase [Paucibacter sp. DJ1R-11]|uniref:S41 family peptidase n=1 Tax=Paucibacter sp. DJ1R-11 TaxID=2893556 RepID=UPI0021E36BE2|nr:S41 family peptidase [Paucibacter sp. DJ1R-11]MCV2361879.1 S41 family peptidase [Paucibacter sp. DJ1R-11]
MLLLALVGGGSLSPSHAAPRPPAKQRLDQAELLQQAGRVDEALALVQADVSDEGLLLRNAWLLLQLQAAAGQLDAAWQTLARMADERQMVPARWLETAKELAPLREDPRWPDALAKARAFDALRERLYGAAAIETPFRETLPLNERLAGLSRLWAEVKTHFVNFELVPGLDWDALYLQTLERVSKTSRTEDYYRELMRMMAQLHDGHSGVVLPEPLRDRMLARPALRTRWIEGRVLIAQLLDPELARLGLAVGQEIMGIEGQALADYVQSHVQPFTSASTPQDLALRLYDYNLLRGDARRAVRLTLKDAQTGVTRQLSVPRVEGKARAALLAKDDASFRWRILPGDVALVELRGFGDDEPVKAYRAAFEQIAKARAIVFDLRENGGGNSSVGYRILSTLSPQPFETSQWWTRSQVSAWRAWGLPLTIEGGSPGLVQPDAQRQFTGPVAVLTSGATYSAAEDFVAAFKRMARGHVVGEATGGSTGQPLFFKLPGGGSARVCSKRDVLPDGTEFVGKGLQPDLLLQPTLAGWRAGRDEVLEAALARISLVSAASR